MTTTTAALRRRPRTSWRRRRQQLLAAGAPPLLLLVWLFLLLLLSSSPPSTTTRHPRVGYCFAREIEATDQWQLLGENDTVPPGLHVKIDLSTGERWAKLIDPDDEETEVDIKAAPAVEGEATSLSSSSSSSSSSAVSIVDEGDDGGSGTAGSEHGGAAANGADGAASSADEKSDDGYDYEMMHRTLSSLPPDELDRIGYPQLPASAEGSLLRLTAEERAAFERKMRQIWDARQEELKVLQEEFVADLPEILKDRIVVLDGYISDPSGGVDRMLSEEEEPSIVEGGTEEGDGNDDTQRIMDVLSALEDLEYHLSDIDMARDFHTLGGWRALATLLSNSAHSTALPSVETNGEGGTAKKEERTKAVHKVQAAAAWAAGTAIKNVGEFHPWAVEDVSSSSSSMASPTEKDRRPVVTVLSLLLEAFAGTAHAEDPSASTANTASASFRARRLKYLYALGAALRGNRLAQQSFLELDGPTLLAADALRSIGDDSEMATSWTCDGGAVAAPTKDWKYAGRVLALADDLVQDVTLHRDMFGSSDGSGGDGGGGSNDHGDADAFVTSMTTGPWCRLAYRMVGRGTEDGVRDDTREKALRAVRALAPHCRGGDGGNGSWGDGAGDGNGERGGLDAMRDAVERVRSVWNREGSGDGIDPVYRRELLELADNVLAALR